MHFLAKFLSPLKTVALVSVIVLCAAVTGAALTPREQSVEFAQAVIPTIILEDQMASSAAPMALPTFVSSDTEVVAPQSLTLLFVGDIMLDRNVYNATKRNGENFEHPFLLMASELARYDVRIANLEGPITTTPFNMKRAQAMSFTFDPQFIVPLAQYFDIVSLANNHTLNQGEKGLRATREYLQKVGVEYFGDPLNRAGDIGRIIERNGFKIGLVGYHAFGTPESKSIPVVEREIKKMRAAGADYIVVMPHWGPEYKPRGAPAQVVAGHRFIDAGADVVIGGHPHVVQNVEEYKGRKIFYSLGNFIFDQYFSAETMEGIMVAAELRRGDDEKAIADFKTIPYKINKESQPFIP